MGRYQMGPYEGMYAATCTPVDNIRAVMLDPDTPFQKLGLHFTTPEARRRVRARLVGLPLEVIDSETTSIELQAAGVDKAAGLLALAELLGIAPEATIAVGDADNDLAMVRAAGIGVAMGNANERVHAAANVSVADNDHGGCAEAIHTYLL
jgi:hydroxymethylpyrimidine pyrophosphatase-like HAD family hydrolase